MKSYKKKVHYLADIKKYYESLLQELEDKMVNPFQEKIKILKEKTTRGNIIYSSHFSPREALHLSDKKNIKFKMREAALNLRNAIKDADVACLSKELTVEDIYKGETDISDLLKTFITYLISGPILNVITQFSKLGELNPYVKLSFMLQLQGGKNLGNIYN